MHSASTSAAPSVASSTTASNTNLNHHPPSSSPDAEAGAVSAVGPPGKAKKTKSQKSRTCNILDWRWITSRTTETDPEKGTDPPSPRPMRLLAPVYGGLGAALSICRYSAILLVSVNWAWRKDFIGSGLSILLSEFKLDHGYRRFALLATAPFLLCVSLVSYSCYRVGTWSILASFKSSSQCKLLAAFACCEFSRLTKPQNELTNACLRIGPVAQYHQNSRYYSAEKPEPNPDVDSRLPHITIEMPVYKESLEDTMLVMTSDHGARTLMND